MDICHIVYRKSWRGSVSDQETLFSITGPILQYLDTNGNQQLHLNILLPLHLPSQSHTVKAAFATPLYITILPVLTSHEMPIGVSHCRRGILLSTRARLRLSDPILIERRSTTRAKWPRNQDIRYVCANSVPYRNVGATVPVDIGHSISSARGLLLIRLSGRRMMCRFAADFD